MAAICHTPGYTDYMAESYSAITTQSGSGIARKATLLRYNIIPVLKDSHLILQM